MPAKKEDAEAIRAGKKKPTDIPDEDRDFYLERRYPAFGNLCPRDIASRAAKERCDAGYGVGTGNAGHLDLVAEVVLHCVGKHEVTVGKTLHERGSSEAVCAVVGEVALADSEEALAEADVRARIEKLMNIKGTKSPDEIHKRLGHVMWNLVGMGRTLQGLIW